MRVGRMATVFVFIPFLACCCVKGADFSKVVRIGVCLSLTGEYAASGKKFLAGIKIRRDDFNSLAAEHGMRLELVVRDDGSNPERSAEAVRELAESEKVAVVIGPMSTNQVLRAAEVARELGVVVISPTATSPDIGRDGDWCFRLQFDDAFQGVVLARFMARKLGMRRAGAIKNDRHFYSRSVFDSFKKAFELEGGTIVAQESYSWVASEEGDFDFLPVLDRISRARPQIVLLPVNSLEVAAIVRASLKAGVDAIFFGGDTWHHEHILYSSGNNIEGSYFISAVNYECGTGEMERYFDLYDISNDVDAQPSSVLGYDTLSLVIKALENGDTAAAIREGLYSIRNFELATGTITIDPERGSEKSAYIHRIDRKGGAFVSSVVDEIKP